MRRRALHHGSAARHVNVTPLIDVVMCMIVFYLIVGKMVSDQRATMKLPEAERGSDAAAQESLFINIVAGAAGTPPGFVIEGEAVAPDALESRIRARVAAEPAMVVHIRGDRVLSYGVVAPVIAACRAAGVESVRLAVEHVE